MLSLKLGDVADFPFVEAPHERAIGDGYRRLIEIGAIDEQHRITAIGQHHRQPAGRCRAGAHADRGRNVSACRAR